jgi:hypothetical protein
LQGKSYFLVDCVGKKEHQKIGIEDFFLEARRVMFYEVKIFDAKGELKKVLSPKKLSNRFWKHGEQNLIDFGDKENSSSSDWGNKKIAKDEYQLEDR